MSEIGDTRQVGGKVYELTGVEKLEDGGEIRTWKRVAEASSYG